MHTSVNDPIADMLTRIRNAVTARHESVPMAASRMKTSIAKILKEEGFIRDYEVVRGGSQRILKIHLAYRDKNGPVMTGLKRVSKPGLRIYVQRKDIPKVYSGLGIVILSTPKGLMTGQQAWRRRLGGEVLCYIW